MNLPYDQKKVRMACFIGSALEYFEFQIFVAFMPYIMAAFLGEAANSFSLFFQGYLIFFLAFLSRPLGSLLLGYVGDHGGRRRALLISMWFMVVSTIGIGLLPSREHWGIGSAIFLVIFRFCQGLSLGGEYSSAFVFLYEHHQSGKIPDSEPRCVHVVWQDMGAVLGLLAAMALSTGMGLVFSSAQMKAFAWRLPFLAAFLIGVCGVYIRNKIGDPASHVSLITENQSRSAKRYYADLFHHWPVILAGIFASMSGGVFWYLGFVFIPEHIVRIQPSGVMALAALTLLAIPFIAKHVADRFGPYRVWAISALGMGLNFVGLILSPEPLWQSVGLVLQVLLLAAVQSPCVLILNQIFPLLVRTSGCAIVYSVANIIAGLTPLMALVLLQWDPSSRALGMVILGVSSLGALGVLFLQRLKKRSDSTN